MKEKSDERNRRDVRVYQQRWAGRGEDSWLEKEKRKRVVFIREKGRRGASSPKQPLSKSALVSCAVNCIAAGEQEGRGRKLLHGV